MTTRPDADLRGVARAGLFAGYRADGTSRWLDAAGVSMQPLLPPGSRLLVVFGPRLPRIGEIAVFEGRAGLVAHRIVARRGRGAGLVLIPKGDAEPFADPPILPVDVLGIVRAVERPDGRRVRAGLGGPTAGLVARVSWWSGRTGRLGRRAARLAPRAMRPAARAAATSLSRVPTRVITASFPRPDRGSTTGRR